MPHPPRITDDAESRAVIGIAIGIVKVNRPTPAVLCHHRRIRAPGSCAIRRYHQSPGRKPGIQNRCTLDMNSQSNPRHDRAGRTQVKGQDGDSAQQARGA
jgi:hypothetical protein